MACKEPEEPHWMQTVNKATPKRCDAGKLSWQPPHACRYDLPCKADCFENPNWMRPGRNPIASLGRCIDQRHCDDLKAAGTRVSRERDTEPTCCTACRTGVGGQAPGRQHQKPHVDTKSGKSPLC